MQNAININKIKLHNLDQGIGFDTQYKLNLFEAFQRLHSKEVYSGTGPRLAIVKKIAANHYAIISATK